MAHPTGQYRARTRNVVLPFPAGGCGEPYSDHLCMSTCELSWTGVALRRWLADISDEVGGTDITKCIAQNEGASTSDALYNVKHDICRLRKYMCACSPTDVIYESWERPTEGKWKIGLAKRRLGGSPHSWRYTPDPTAKGCARTSVLLSGVPLSACFLSSRPPASQVH